MIDEIAAIAREAGDIAMGHFGRAASLNVETKGAFDFVTTADREVERLIVDRLRSLFPDDGIVGEEGAAAPSRSGRTWVVDPIDGTFNFVRGADQWSISIGLFDGARPALGVINLPAQRRLVEGGYYISPRLNGEPLRPLSGFDPGRAVVALGLGPASTDHRAADLVRSISGAGLLFRYCGCGTASLVSAMCGEVDGYVSLAESSWDVMAGLAILRGLGFRDTVDWARVGLRQKFPLVCGSAELLDLVAPLAFLQRISLGGHSARQGRE